MNEVTIKQILGKVEVIDGGKKTIAKVGTRISLDTKIITGSSAKVEIEINGQVYEIRNDQNVTIKDFINKEGGNSDPTSAGGVRG